MPLPRPLPQVTRPEARPVQANHAGTPSLYPPSEWAQAGLNQLPHLHQLKSGDRRAKAREVSEGVCQWVRPAAMDSDPQRPRRLRSPRCELTAVRSVEVIGAGPEAVEGRRNVAGVGAVAAPSCCTWPVRPEAKFIGRQAGPIHRLVCWGCPWLSVGVHGRTWRSSLRLLSGIATWVAGSARRRFYTRRSWFTAGPSKAPSETSGYKAAGIAPMQRSCLCYL